MDRIEEALEDLRLLEPGESINIAATAKKYGVERSTLLKY
jgi:CMP-2-keto-3-deoxyoctulosonic acid synthetase